MLYVYEGLLLIAVGVFSVGVGLYVIFGGE